VTLACGCAGSEESSIQENRAMASASESDRPAEKMKNLMDLTKQR
jgi:hypothetical protein